MADIKRLTIRKYYKCYENNYVWSYRERTSEELVIVLVNDYRKEYSLENYLLVDMRLQEKLEKKLRRKGYKRGNVYVD